MAQLVVRNLEENVKALLQRRASRHGCSMEEEIRDILRNAVRGEAGAPTPLGSRLKQRFAGIGLDGDIEELRGEQAQPADFNP
ncbi:MAG TPA: plasmid stabilization protein [Azospirillaceae bacterium]|jgi:antitoxin FitA|nr:plasmid stabilization protein [Azospirillaceae bacterium]